MAIMRVSELTGIALDWAVAQCDGYTGLHKIAGRKPHEPQLGIWPPRKEYGVMDLWELSYSTDWAQGGPIIEREGIELFRNNEKNYWFTSKARGQIGTGPSPLIAAMRCYVASKLGDQVDVPLPLIG